MIAERTRRGELRQHAVLAGIVAAVLLHLAIILLLASALPGTVAHARADHLHHHAPLADDHEPTQGGRTLNVLPPEVRSLGGHDHESLAPLPVTPGIAGPSSPVLEDVARTFGALAAPDAPAPAGRAPPHA